MVVGFSDLNKNGKYEDGDSVEFGNFNDCESGTTIIKGGKLAIKLVGDSGYDYSLDNMIEQVDKQVAEQITGKTEARTTGNRTKSFKFQWNNTGDTIEVLNFETTDVGAVTSMTASLQSVVLGGKLNMDSSDLDTDIEVKGANNSKIVLTFTTSTYTVNGGPSITYISPL